jgi:hypothetical protein
MTSNDEKINFEMNGTDLLLRDINLYCTTRANQRAIVEQMKQLATTNNTAGATIFDLGNVIQSSSLSEINHVLKNADKKAEAQRKEQMAHEQEMARMENEQRTMEKQMSIDHDTLEAEKDRRKDVLVAEIKSAGYGAMQDLNANQQSDYLDAMETIKSSDEFSQTMSFENQKESAKKQQNAEKTQLAREKIQAQLAMKQKDVQIAEINKNQFDLKKTVQKKNEAKKKK